MTDEMYNKAALAFYGRLCEQGPWVTDGMTFPMTFPWDIFCKLNPDAQSLAYEVEKELGGYQFSEFQCSWAVVKYLQSVKTS